MNDDIILKVENLSKQYRLGTVGTGTISHDLNRFLARIRGKQDPYLKIGESNDRSRKSNSEYVWALKDINFEVRKGEVLGIIGKNGAGKSTLLKILSKVTSPSTGVIKSKGRIASLLEVGTGFHPEMTGKENIFLNGAILGMTKKEIASKLDEIVSFSGCERYINTPVKRYSSGMKVRLAFAVAAHLEPDILVVDEVLAVGDAEFQKKAIGKMQDISNSDGRTVLFVSHDMGAIESICKKILILNNGKIFFEGKTLAGIDKYLNDNKEKTNLKLENKYYKIVAFNLYQNDKKTNVLKVYEPTIIKGRILILNKVIPEDIKIEIMVKDLLGKTKTTISTWLNSYSFSPEGNTIEFEVELSSGFLLNTNEYVISLNLHDFKNHYFDSIINFELISNIKTGYKNPLKTNIHGDYFTPNKWKIKSFNNE